MSTKGRALTTMLAGLWAAGSAPGGGSVRTGRSREEHKENSHHIRKARLARKSKRKMAKVSKRRNRR